MNILFLSMLSSKRSCGPYYSIPNQVAAQRRFDNVFWLNMNDVQSEEWKQWADVKTKIDYPELSLSTLPTPFSNPDIVVVEEQYNFFCTKIMREVIRKGIPYVIVPRCSLTKEALQKKKIKKSIANLVYFNMFISRATGIQYLTNQEKEASGDTWNKTNFVIPNGIAIPNLEKHFNKDRVDCSFIGRIDVYHKGLDFLLGACEFLKEELVKNKIHISIYGSGNEQDIDYLTREITNKNIEQIISYHGPVYDIDKRKVLLQSDAFILTSRFEGLPMGILEALSYGIPVLATEGTNMADVINEYNAGWTSQTNVEGIRGMLERFIEQKELIPSVSDNCIKLARTYSWESIAEQTHMILNKLIQEKRK